MYINDIKIQIFLNVKVHTGIKSNNFYNEKYMNNIKMQRLCKRKAGK